MKPDPAVDAAMHLIRQKILDGSWPSGAKIPTRCELAELVGTSASTIQAAMRKLVAEGSLITRKRAGTLVAPHPPEHGRFALVLSHPPRTAVRAPPRALGGSGTDAQPPGSQFVRALVKAAAAVATIRLGWRMDVLKAHCPELSALCASGGLAGMVYFGIPEGRPAACEIPVALFENADYQKTCPHALIVALDLGSLFTEGIARLMAIARTRIAVFATGALHAEAAPAVKGSRVEGAGVGDAGGKAGAGPVGSSDPDVEFILQTLRDAKAETCSSWIQPVDPLRSTSVRQLSLLLFDQPQRRRPNALILMDDHLLPPVLATLNALGLRVPQDVAVVVLENNPAAGRIDGCIGLGFDVGATMLAILDNLSARRRGQRADGVMMIRVTAGVAKEH